jgi:hypothetical protein
VLGLEDETVRLVGAGSPARGVELIGTYPE